MKDFPIWIDHAAAIFYGLVVPFYATWQRPRGFSGIEYSTATKKRIYISGSLTLFILALLLILVWMIYKRSFSGLGFTLPVEDNEWIWWLSAFILLYIVDVTRSLLMAKDLRQSIRRWKDRTPFTPTKWQEIPLYLVMCVSAGICEEIIYRGFLITYFLQVFRGTGNPELWALSIPAILFAGGHYYQGARAVLKIFVLSVLFGLIFLRSGSLLPVMILHFLIDAAGGFFSLKYMSSEQETDEVMNSDPS